MHITAGPSSGPMHLGSGYHYSKTDAKLPLLSFFFSVRDHSDVTGRARVAMGKKAVKEGLNLCMGHFSVFRR